MHAADLLSLIYQYRHLLGRREVLHQPLDDDREARLLALSDLFACRPRPGASRRAERRRMARCEVNIDAVVEVRGRSMRTTIVDIGGDGLQLEPAPPVGPGEHVTVKLQDLRRGREYRFPVEVRWRTDGGRASVGARFAGMPIELCHRRRQEARDDESAAP